MLLAAIAFTAFPFSVVSDPAIPNSGTALQAPARADEVLRDLDGRPIGSARDVEQALGGAFANPFAANVQVLPAGNDLWEITLNDTGTGWAETFLVGMPDHPLSPAPMLVVFHGWGNTQWDIPYRTRYFQMGMARGWIVVAPLGAHKFNFAIDYAQKNTQVALDWVLDGFDVDRERIYGVGFSMGGGNAVTYAARHLDPRHARFAAAVDHTGTVSIRDVWQHATDTSLLEHDLMFQGPPSQYPFRYQRASSIDMNVAGHVDPDTDLARNLRFLPLRVFAVAGDPNQHLVEQSTTLWSHLKSLGGNPELVVVNGSVHRWSTMDERTVLDWLDPQRWTDPAPGTPVRVLADRNAVWHHFAILQEHPNEFSPFRWTVDLANNRVVLDQVENVGRIAFHPGKAGLEFHDDSDVEVMLDLVGDKAVDVVLEGYDHVPSAVVRTGTANASWTWDPARRTVTLHETDGDNYPRWIVTP